MEIITRHQLRPEHLNHHNTLYAGQIMDWMAEAAFIATARLRHRTDHIVMAGAENIRLLRPMVPGEILELGVESVTLGVTSIHLHIQGRELLSGAPCCTGELAFVTVDDEGKKCPHGLQ
ncbi:MAG: acyl-CoA thioesterase [Clostridiales bacterium]|nr:acyl-CoA thioesterase [Clostridiales bacterium]